MGALFTLAPSLLPSLLGPPPQHTDVLSHFSTQNETNKLSLLSHMLLKPFSLRSPSEPGFSEMFTEHCVFPSGPILSSVVPSCLVLHPPFLSASQITSVWSQLVMPFRFQATSPFKVEQTTPSFPSTESFFVSVTLYSSGFLPSSFPSPEVWAWP